MTYFTRGEKRALCERFDLIDGVGLHAQIRHYWSGLRGRGPVLNLLKGRGTEWAANPSSVALLVFRGSALVDSFWPQSRI